MSIEHNTKGNLNYNIKTKNDKKRQTLLINRNENVSAVRYINII